MSKYRIQNNSNKKISFIIKFWVVTLSKSANVGSRTSVIFLNLFNERLRKG